MDLDELLPIIKLHGDSYRLLKKAAFYSTLAHLVRKSKITIVNQEMDLRIPAMYVLPSGYGKRELKDFIKENTPPEPQRVETYCEPTSLHPEQLVGKTLIPRSQTGSYEKVRGFLGSTFLVIDEAIQVLVDGRYEEARKYIRFSLDPIGKNTITKRLTGIPPQHAIEYSPDCSMALFFQPVGWSGNDRLPRHLLSEGLLRRFVILYAKISDEERLSGFRLSHNPVNDKQAQSLWAAAQTNIVSIGANQSVDWDVSSVVGLLFDGADQLVKIGHARGGQCREFALMAFYDLLKHLSRMSCVQAGVDGRTIIESQDVKEALRDLTETWELQLNFVAEMIQPPRGIHNVNPRDIEALRVLINANCTDQAQSQMSIHEFKEEIDDEHGNVYRRLKDGGLVDGKQVGSHDSRVWLTPKGAAMVSSGEP